MAEHTIAQVAPAPPVRPELPLEDWIVVFTGLFEIKPRCELEKALRSRGVRVSPSIDKYTTHLIMGNGSGVVTRYQVYTGIGGSKHQFALALNVPIIGEEDAWARVKTTKGSGRWKNLKRKGVKRKRIDWAEWADSVAAGNNVQMAMEIASGSATQKKEEEVLEVKKEEEVLEVKKEEEVLEVEKEAGRIALNTNIPGTRVEE